LRTGDAVRDNFIDILPREILTEVQKSLNVGDVFSLVVLHFARAAEK